MNKLLRFVGNIYRGISRTADDFLILLGAGCLVYATYLLSLIAAIYLLGIILIAAGAIIGLGQRGNRNDHS